MVTSQERSVLAAQNSFTQHPGSPTRRCTSGARSAWSSAWASTRLLCPGPRCAETHLTVHWLSAWRATAWRAKCLLISRKRNYRVQIMERARAAANHRACSALQPNTACHWDIIAPRWGHAPLPVASPRQTSGQQFGNPCWQGAMARNGGEWGGVRHDGRLQHLYRWRAPDLRGAPWAPPQSQGCKQQGDEERDTWGSRALRRAAAEHEAAYGPRGGSVEESISVVAAPLAGAELALRDLGAAATPKSKILRQCCKKPGDEERDIRGGRAPRQTAAEPGAAYSPPGGSGEESISVVAAPLARAARRRRRRHT